MIDFIYSFQCSHLVLVVGFGRGLILFHQLGGYMVDTIVVFCACIHNAFQAKPIYVLFYTSYSGAMMQVP